MQKLLIITTLCAASVSQTACSGLLAESMFVGDDEGRLLLSTDAEGLRAFADMQNGLVVTGKATADEDTAYHENRRHQEEQRTLRVRLPRFASAKKKEISK